MLGETSVTPKEVDFEKVVRDVTKGIGFDADGKGLNCNTCRVHEFVKPQEPEIARGVWSSKKEEDLGAGDQGLMFGYATDEWDKELLHPCSHVLANQLAEELARQRHAGEITWLRPDCKTQVIVEYKKESDGRMTPMRVHSILISTQHSPDVSMETIRETIVEKVIKKVVPEKMLMDTRMVINPSGSFVEGGPEADAGLTGRKIIVDTYGGWAPHGGGAFSGKDPTKVDRSAAYYARYVAKSIVAAGLAHRCLIQISYAIGLADPLSVHVDSYGTVQGGRTDDDLKTIVEQNFNFRPYSMIKELNLMRPIYLKTAKFGHFGRNDPDFTWEMPKKDMKF